MPTVTNNAASVTFTWDFGDGSAHSTNQYADPSLSRKLPVKLGLCYLAPMSVTDVIEEIKQLTATEQAEVIQFALQLARTRPLTAGEPTTLARRMAESDDPAEVERLKTSIAHGFYGG